MFNFSFDLKKKLIDESKRWDLSLKFKNLQILLNLCFCNPSRHTKFYRICKQFSKKEEYPKFYDKEIRFLDFKNKDFQPKPSKLVLFKCQRTSLNEKIQERNAFSRSIRWLTKTKVSSIKYHLQKPIFVCSKILENFERNILRLVNKRYRKSSLFERIKFK